MQKFSESSRINPKSKGNFHNTRFPDKRTTPVDQKRIQKSLFWHIYGLAMDKY